MKKIVLLISLVLLITVMTACSSSNEITVPQQDDKVATLNDDLPPDVVLPVDDEQEQVKQTAVSLLPLDDESFLAAAGSLLDDYAKESGSGAIYVEILNDEGTDYYGTVNETALVVASYINDVLTFKNKVSMANTFSFKNVLQQKTADYDCVDDQEDLGTSEYDVFGYKGYFSPNILKPYDNDLCELHIVYEDGVYTGSGTAITHFYSYTPSGYHNRSMRFTFVYKE